MILYYLSHPEVDIDPDVPVPDWGLSAKGRDRVSALAASGWSKTVARVLTSPERKARETAALLAAPRRLVVEVVAGSGEVDRSAAGYVPHDRHEALANALFAHPDKSAAGWETARAAQARVASALAPWLGIDGDSVVVGHGGFGTLLWCHLTGRPIARAEDQPGGGHVWAARHRGGDWHPVHPWMGIEALIAAGLDAPPTA